MNASEAKLNEKYLTKSGIPVVVVRRDGDKVVLRAETTGNENTVERTYPLQAYTEEKVNRDAKLLLKANGKAKKDGKSGKKVRDGSLAAIIDPFLVAGGHTIKEIAAELKKKAGPQANGKDLEANCRARLWSFKRKGYSVERDTQKRIRVIEHAKRTR